MRRFFYLLLLLLPFSAIACGGSDQGPADPSETPQVSEEDVQKAMTSSMPEDAKKMYENYQQGGTPK